MLEWSHCLSYPLSLIIFLHVFLHWSVFAEVSAAAETECDKSEVDARSIYVGNVRLSSIFASYTNVI